MFLNVAKPVSYLAQWSCNTLQLVGHSAIHAYGLMCMSVYCSAHTVHTIWPSVCVGIIVAHTCTYSLMCVDMYVLQWCTYLWPYVCVHIVCTCTIVAYSYVCTCMYVHMACAHIAVAYNTCTYMYIPFIVWPYVSIIHTHTHKAICTYVLLSGLLVVVYCDSSKPIKFPAKVVCISSQLSWEEN